MIGTLGIVLHAKKRGLIPEARPVAESLLSNGPDATRRTS
jgi:predicted nucleic acid-binding protein